MPPSRKPREKTRYAMETLHDLDTSAALPEDDTLGKGWAPLEITVAGDPVQIHDFSDAAEAMTWVEKNVTPPARVRCVVVKWDVELKEETVKTTKVVPVA